MASVLFPLPLGPTTATALPSGIVNETLLSTVASGRDGYENETLRNSTVPDRGASLAPVEAPTLAGVGKLSSRKRLSVIPTDCFIDEYTEARLALPAPTITL